MKLRIPSPAMIVSVIALLFALSGTAVAGGLITGKQIQNNTVSSLDLANNTVQSIDVKNNSLTTLDRLIVGADGGSLEELLGSPTTRWLA